MCINEEMLPKYSLSHTYNQGLALNSLQIVTYKLFFYKSHTHTHTLDLALDSLQWLICPKTQATNLICSLIKMFDDYPFDHKMNGIIA